MFVKADKKTIRDFYENAKRDKTFYEVVPVGASAIYSNDDDVNAIRGKQYQRRLNGYEVIPVGDKYVPV